LRTCWTSKEIALERRGCSQEHPLASYKRKEFNLPYNITLNLDEIQLETAMVEMLKNDYSWLDLTEDDKEHFRTVLRFYMTGEEYESWYEDTH
jgi:hypothetical protein